ncbi:cupin domain-containing protein [Spirosoma validum]|uniref:Cupin domain-containing protein n=1 Tax=Spirosoma validum TaxID=2771355 RepID=A0A927B4W4_9BACT|nr:cupin domain-containing protein [Spirosoma validum]MBD2755444.1 cupin domain-containing protein [Spirosoma validum]
MAYANKTISNNVTGQTIRFIKTAKDTDGELLEMESTYTAQSTEPAEHYHPKQVEDFTVLSGELTVRIDGKTKTLRPGDKLHVPQNTVHSMWSQTDKNVVVNWQVRPAMDTEYFFETVMGLAQDGKVSAKGMPPILQVVLMVTRFSKVFRLTKPGPVVQKIVFTLLTPLAYLAGYRPTYRKYLD